MREVPGLQGHPNIAQPGEGRARGFKEARRPRGVSWLHRILPDYERP